ncbi:MAG: hypothetical protein KC544_14190, partial [Gemmatimonadetes bacterium]|nr:hypothetical protein [Gemmatimonadota bacterium]
MRTRDARSEKREGFARARRHPGWTEPSSTASLPASRFSSHWLTLHRTERGTEFIGIVPTRVLNPPATTGMAFWSLNPYVGCEFGCAY